MDKIQAYIGAPPEPTCFIDDAIEIDYFVKALETRLKYCPDQNVCILLSAESTRRIVKALKEQEEREKRICKEICDMIRGTCSTDTYEDKDFVCHEIQKLFTEGR